MSQINREAVPADGSRTITAQRNPEHVNAEPGSAAQIVGTLRLRGTRSGPRVKWDDEVVDNEGMGKKKSKSTFQTCFLLLAYADSFLRAVCCIYHKPKQFDESSDESSSDEDDDDSAARPSRSFADRRRHVHGDDGCEHVHGHDESDNEHNAYERGSWPKREKGRA
jgi:protein phosphatase 1 regulatory subunit 11